MKKAPSIRAGIYFNIKHKQTCCVFTCPKIIFHSVSFRNSRVCISGSADKARKMSSNNNKYSYGHHTWADPEICAIKASFAMLISTDLHQRSLSTLATSTNVCPAVS